MRFLFTIVFLFGIAKAQVPIGDTLYEKVAFTLIDSTSFYNTYKANGSISQRNVLWKNARIPNGGTYEELDYVGGQQFSSKGYAVHVTIDSLGHTEVIQYLGLNRKPFPIPYIPVSWEHPRGGTAPRKIGE